ncbi:trehalose-phosphatase [Bordetella genomosp. 10]|uniref:Trehalose 6-phosphate phosphatase n=1 Tax=Bordetella genomosp. 10 TaxID=1416804 RepID=A0A261RYW3_9BORD|nr:trehalose-phosphatase [Bordetella genomosp. 10]OZI30284.1 trehalose-phosphatase [Bordetella genomosp. 10]
MQSKPLPVTKNNITGYAFLFDMDGTLAPIAASPEQAAVPAATRETLEKLREACGGALAIVSGRPISEIDHLLAPEVYCAGGLHGAQLRGPDGRQTQLGVDSEAVAAMVRALLPLAQAHPGLQLEDKGLSLALHYRNAPDLQGLVSEAVNAALLPHTHGFVLQPGKMVLEIKPRHASKAGAITRLMDMPPFAGRRPLFAGDDLTDEAGFEAIHRMDGVSIKIGDGETRAQWRMPTPAALAAWLDLLC